MRGLTPRSSFGAHFPPAGSYPHVPILTLAHFWLYDQSRVYVAVTAIVLRVHASRCATRSGESRVLLAHVFAAGGQGFVATRRRDGCPGPSRSAGQFQRDGNIMKMSIADARESALHLRDKGAGCVRNLRRCPLWRPPE